MTLAFDNTYARLPERFFARVAPAPVTAPRLIRINHALTQELGLDPFDLSAPDGVALLAGNRVPDGASPLAMAYAGHQFGGFVPQLGDGRAILLGEILSPAGRRFDIHLKGSGRTPFSRGGDGRAWLGPVLREYILGEAMHALGIPTTRALAAVTTGETVWREGPKPGAVLVRVARGHVRVGTFEYFKARRDLNALRTLADYVIDRHYPELRADEQPYGALLDRVIEGQAALVARWLAVGFIHGVMNTDNMSVACETIDYGPCAFMDDYHPARVYSSIDLDGRYAYGNQPAIAQWNLSRLAEALLPLIDADTDAALARAQGAIDAFPARFEQARLACFRAKLGLGEPATGDDALIDGLLDAMMQTGADFTNSFRALSAAAIGDEGPIRAQLARSGKQDAPERLWQAWAPRWRERLAQEPQTPAARVAAMDRANPALIPRNHRVEQTLASAVEGDLAPLDALLDALADPFTGRQDGEKFTLPPGAHEVVHQTFCGT